MLVEASAFLQNSLALQPYIDGSYFEVESG